MKCPYCKEDMQFQGYPHHKYSYYTCQKGTEIRIIKGKNESK